jgi:hypothetical protein
MMVMFNYKKILVFLDGKDWVSINDISLGIDLSKTKTRNTLFGLKYKRLVENNGDNWRIIVPPLKPVKDAALKLGDSVSIEAASVPIIEPPPRPEEIPEEKEPESPDPNPELQHKGLSAKVDELNTKIDMALGVRQQKEKKARLKKFSLGKIKRYNRRKGQAVIILERNHNIRLVRGERINGMVKVKDNYHDGSARYTWLFNGKQPVCIIPEWDIKPINADDLDKKTFDTKSHIDSQVINIRAMTMIEQDKEQGDKKKMNWLFWVGVAAAIGIVVWVIAGGIKG